MTKQKEVREGTAKKLAELEGFTWDWIVENKFEDEWFGKADELLSYQDSQGVVIKVDRELPSYLKELAELKSAGGNTYGLICKFCGATCDITDDTFKFREQHESCWAGYEAVESLLDTGQKRGV